MKTSNPGVVVRHWITSALLLLALSAASLKPSLAADPSAPGERTPARNRVFIEILGSGLLYSVNYEIMISDRAGFRLGAGGLAAPSATYIVGFGMPALLIGRGTHTAVIAAGVGLGWIEEIAILESTGTSVAYGIAALGYQFQPHPRGFFIRGSFTPIVTNRQFSPWGGVSVGAAF